MKGGIVTKNGMKLLTGSRPGLLDPSQPSRILKDPRSHLLFYTVPADKPKKSKIVSSIDHGSSDAKVEKRSAWEIGPDGTCLQTLSVPQPIFEEGFVLSGVTWPKLVSIGTDWIYFSREQWDIYNIDSAYNCFIGPYHWRIERINEHTDADQGQCELFEKAKKAHIQIAEEVSTADSVDSQIHTRLVNVNAEETLKDAEEKLARTASRLEVLTREIACVESRLAEAEEEAGGAETRQRDASITLAYILEAVENTQPCLSQLEASVADAEAKLVDTNARLADTGAQVEEAQRYLEHAKEGTREAEARLRDATTSLNAAMAREEDVRCRLTDLDMRVTISETKLSSTSAELADTGAQVEEARHRLERAEEDVKKTEARLRDATTSLNAAMAREEDVRCRLTDLDTRVTISETKLSSTSAELADTGAQVEEARHRLERAEEDVKKTEARLRDATTSLNAAIAQEEDVRCRLADLETSVTVSKTKLSSTSAELADTGAQVEEAQHRLERAEEDVKKTEARLRDATTSLNALTAQEEDVQCRLADLEAEVAVSEAKLSHASTELANTDAQVEEARHRLEHAEEDVKKTEARLRDATTSLNALTAQEEDVQCRLADLEAKVAISETKLSHASTELADAGAQVEDVRHRLERAEEDVKKTEAKLRDATTSLRAVIAQEEDAQRRLADLETKISNSETKLSHTITELDGVDAQVEEAQHRLERAEEGANEAEARPRKATTTLDAIQVMAKISDAQSRLADLHARTGKAERRPCVDKQVGTEGTAEIPETRANPVKTRFTDEASTDIGANLDHLQVVRDGAAQIADAVTLLGAEADSDKPTRMCSGTQVADEGAKVNEVDALAGLIQSSLTIPSQMTATDTEPEGHPVHVEGRSNSDSDAKPHDADGETRLTAEGKSKYVSTSNASSKLASADARVDDDPGTSRSKISRNSGSITTEAMEAQSRHAHVGDRPQDCETQLMAKPNDGSVPELAGTDASVDAADAVLSRAVANAASVMAGTAEDRSVHAKDQADDTDTKPRQAAETRPAAEMIPNRVEANDEPPHPDGEGAGGKASREGQAGEAKAELASVKAELAHAKASLNVVREEIEETQKKKTALEREATRAREVITDAKEHIARKDKSKEEAAAGWRKVASTRARAKEDLDKIKAAEVQTKSRLAEIKEKAERIEHELATRREAVAQASRRKEELEGDVMELEGTIAELQTKIQEGKDQYANVEENVRRSTEALMDAKKRQDEFDQQDKLNHTAIAEMRAKMDADRQRVLDELAGALQRKERLDYAAADVRAKIAADEQEFYEARSRLNASIEELQRQLAALEERVRCEEETESRLGRAKELLSGTIAELETKMKAGIQEVMNIEVAIADAQRRKNELDYAATKSRAELEESMRLLANVEETTLRAQRRKEQLDQEIAGSETMMEERAADLADLEEKVRRAEGAEVDAQRRADQLERRTSTFERLLRAYNIPPLDRIANPEQMLGTRLWSERDELTSEEMEVEDEPHMMSSRLKRACTKEINGDKHVEVDYQALTGADDTYDEEGRADAGAVDIAVATGVGDTGSCVERTTDDDSEHTGASTLRVNDTCVDEQDTQGSAHPTDIPISKRNTSQKLKLDATKEAQAWFREQKDLHRRNRLAWRSVSAPGSNLNEQAFRTWYELWGQWTSFRGYYLSREAVVAIGTKRTLEFRDVPWPTMQLLGVRNLKDAWKSLKMSNEDARKRDEQDVETCFEIITKNAFQGDRKKAAIRLLQVFHPDKWSSTKYAWFGKEGAKDVEMAVRMVSTTLGKIKNAEESR
ncbi:hypothetical protein K488DRAFT_73614 [Vararia minispora EC-137]|uniref:Uncharacterized protein n=1 Tax=Vararia minispora EC-137 TaxID=1314806 RepID=A0ACB8QBI8_9AGAM|nr:hypothetical protein K488DRAFT_73614 [Vararia minispora EC-137]